MSGSSDDGGCCLMFMLSIGGILLLAGIVLLFSFIIGPALNSVLVAWNTPAVQLSYPVSDAKKSGTILLDDSGGVSLGNGGSLEFDVNAPSADSYRFIIVDSPSSSYTFPYTTVDVSVNGEQAFKAPIYAPIDINLANTGIAIQLQAGSNTIAISNQTDPYFECSTQDTKNTCAFIGSILLLKWR